MDQYMDSYGDKITIGCLGKIAYYRLLISFPCGNEAKMGGVCARSSPDVREHLSMNESIECVCVCVHILACVMREYELQ